ncbi:MAG TPA: YsnF/AvaK domain-containing protein [Terriglobales bacterium]
MMAYEKIVAVYDKAGKAKDAVRALESSGFPSGDISVLNRDSLTDAEVHEAGLWRRLFGRNVGDHESAVYGRTIEAGGAVLTLRLQDSDVARAMKILDVHNPVDISDRASNLGVATPAVPKPATPAPSVSVPSVTNKSVAKEEVLRLAEEQVDVGKRQVETGRARVRRFIIEKPVESQVTLHEEHAEMLRRAVSDPSLIKDIDWSEKTIEITETAEQAVVTKSAHIAEEVVIRREGSDHVETVRETIRRQQVELERLPRDIKKAA